MPPLASNPWLRRPPPNAWASYERACQRGSTETVRCSLVRGEPFQIAFGGSAAPSGRRSHVTILVQEHDRGDTGRAVGTDVGVQRLLVRPLRDVREVRRSSIDQELLDLCLTAVDGDGDELDIGILLLKLCDRRSR